MRRYLLENLLAGAEGAIRLSGEVDGDGSDAAQCLCFRIAGDYRKAPRQCLSIRAHG